MTSYQEAIEKWKWSERAEFRGRRPQPCTAARPHPQVGGVCVCGADLSRHPLGVAVRGPYMAAIWKWALKNGGVPDYYGGFRFEGSVAVLEHLECCEVDYEKSVEPAPGSWETFAGTFADGNDKVTGIVGYLTCRCEWVDNEQWVVSRELSVGELIFEVLKEVE